MRKKVVIYLLTFVAAVSLNWIIPRFMPGDPIKSMLAKYALHPETKVAMEKYIRESYGMDKPLLEQYFNFWGRFLHGDLGTSLIQSPAKVMDLLLGSVPYTAILLFPSLILSWFAGNWLGAMAARRKRLDNTVLPIMYILTSIPYNYLGFILVWVLGVLLSVFPYAFAYSPSVMPSFSMEFILDFLAHWALPSMALFFVQLGGWAIGMRNMIIYELEANYSRYLECLGAPNTLIRKYAYKNAILPQVTGLGLAIGLVIAGNITVEIVFSYPGLGNQILKAVNSHDFFVMQGGFIFLIIGILLSNFIIDIIYIFLDPRVRYAYGENK